MVWEQGKTVAHLSDCMAQSLRTQMQAVDGAGGLSFFSIDNVLCHCDQSGNSI